MAIRHMRSEIAWLTRAVPTASNGFIAAIARSSVDFPVPGGPSSTTWQPLASVAASTSASRRRPTIRSETPASSDPASVLVDEHSPDVLAVEEVLVALVDLVERVLLGH